MSQHLDTSRTPAGRTARPEVVAGTLPPDHRALATGGTWLRDGTEIRVPRRARLALVRLQMLKARVERPAGS